jgi:hypothetical protein
MSRQSRSLTPLEGETEVFFITPEQGKCYNYAEATRKVIQGLNNRKYFTTNPLEYVGKFVRHEQRGQGNGADHWYIFNLNGTEKKIPLSYEGNTCLVETPCRTGGPLGAGAGAEGGRRRKSRKGSRKTRNTRKNRKLTRRH